MKIPSSKLKYKILNDDEIIQITELYRKGLSQNEIGKILGVSTSTIGNTLRKVGVEIRSNKLSEDEKDKIIKLYNEGFSQNKISKQMERTTKHY